MRFSQNIIYSLRSPEVVYTVDKGQQLLPSLRQRVAPAFTEILILSTPGLMQKLSRIITTKTWSPSALIQPICPSPTTCSPFSLLILQLSGFRCILGGLLLRVSLALIPYRALCYGGFAPTPMLREGQCEAAHPVTALCPLPGVASVFSSSTCLHLVLALTFTHSANPPTRAGVYWQQGIRTAVFLALELRPRSQWTVNRNFWKRGGIKDFKLSIF